MLAEKLEMLFVQADSGAEVGYEVVAFAVEKIPLPINVIYRSVYEVFLGVIFVLESEGLLVLKEKRR
jgi:hypothetical protein